MKSSVIRIPTSALFLAATLAVGVALNTPAAPSPIAVQLDPKNAGAAISPQFSGLGFEVSILRSDFGTHYFRPDNQPLITLFHTLGIKSLRLGGNTSDRDVRQLPSQEDLDSLFQFAKAADVKVIYCLRLHNGDPTVDAETAKYIMDHYSSLVDCFSIGQEPSAYPVEKKDDRANNERMGANNEKYSYTDYRTAWKQFADAIVAAAPNVNFCGPSVHNNGDWARHFIEDFDRSNHVTLVTEHLYPGGAGGKVPSPEIGRDRMLSDDFVNSYQKLYNGFAPMASSNGLPYRLEEVNNYFNGGATNVSNTFASALWGLDFMYWWAEHQATGVNFHTGDRVAAGSSLQPSRYTAFFSTTNGYLIRPLGYGIKAFDLGGHGRFLQANISNSDHLNLDAYAVLGTDKSVCITLINKEHGSSARDASVGLTAGGSFAHGDIISLNQASGDVAATSGVTLGGTEINSDGTWAGAWKPLAARGPGVFAVNVPAASAVIVRLTAAKSSVIVTRY